MFFGLLNSLSIPHFLGKYVAWVDIRNDAEAILHRSEPAGMVDGVFTFLCKAQVPSERWKPGALVVGNDTQLYCHIGDFGAQKVRKYQMSTAPRSTISWIPYSRTLLINPIYAGHDGGGVPTYPCRVWVGSNLYLGHFAVGDHKCYFAQDDTETSATSGVEVLTVNAFARAYFSQMNSCKSL